MTKIYENELFVLIVGDPVDGFYYYGPFTYEEAEEKMDHFKNDYRWIAKLHSLKDL